MKKDLTSASETLKNEELRASAQPPATFPSDAPAPPPLPPSRKPLESITETALAERQSAKETPAIAPEDRTGLFSSIREGNVRLVCSPQTLTRFRSSNLSI